MEAISQKIHAKIDRSIYIEATAGHFATNHSHINYYVNMTDLKSRHQMAQAGAGVLADRYLTTPIDTVLCLEGTEIIGAFLADHITRGQMSVNSGANINVLQPESNANNQMIFRDNTQDMVRGKNVLLLMSTVTTGKTIRRSLDCLEYYGGTLVGIAALFSAARKVGDTEIYSIFTVSDLPGYRTYLPGECELCRAKTKVDALVNSFGYSKI